MRLQQRQRRRIANLVIWERVTLGERKKGRNDTTRKTIRIQFEEEKQQPLG
jgi:hypothetical protein